MLFSVGLFYIVLNWKVKILGQLPSHFFWDDNCPRISCKKFLNSYWITTIVCIFCFFLFACCFMESFLCFYSFFFPLPKQMTVMRSWSVQWRLSKMVTLLLCQLIPSMVWHVWLKTLRQSERFTPWRGVMDKNRWPSVSEKFRTSTSKWFLLFDSFHIWKVDFHHLSVIL